MKPKISFLIATKNRGAVIKDTLQSLIKQEVVDWEAIIIDDHGNDETKKITGGFNDKRFRYFKLLDGHGMGAGCARNFAAVQAQADIVAILDSDDIAYPNRVHLTIGAFTKNHNADVFFGNIDIWEEKTGLVRDRKTPFLPFSLARMKKQHFIPHSTVAIKKQILLDNPYNQFFKMAEDYELLTRLAFSGKKFIYTNEKVLKYRLSDQNMSFGDEIKKELTTSYGLLVKMLRGWLPMDDNLLKRIEELEGIK